VTMGIGVFFLLPGIIWFASRRWWDSEGNDHLPRVKIDERTELSAVHQSVE